MTQDDVREYMGMKDAIYKGKFVAVTRVTKNDKVLRIHVSVQSMGDRLITRFTDVEAALSEHWDEAEEFRIVFPKEIGVQDILLVSAKYSIAQFFKSRGKEVHYGIRQNVVYFNKGVRIGDAHSPLNDGLTCAPTHLKTKKQSECIHTGLHTRQCRVCNGTGMRHGRNKSKEPKKKLPLWEKL